MRFATCIIASNCATILASCLTIGSLLLQGMAGVMSKNSTAANDDDTGAIKVIRTVSPARYAWTGRRQARHAGVGTTPLMQRFRLVSALVSLAPLHHPGHPTI